MSSTVFFADASGNELAVLTCTFEVNGVPADPATVSLVVTDPSGAQVTYTYAGGQVSRIGTGVYRINVACLLDGLWSYVWIGTGTAADVLAGTWTVAPAAVGRWYTSVAELKSRVGITDTQDDFELTLAVQAAAVRIEEMCGRFFWNAAGTRTYRPDSIYDLEIDDLVSVTQLATDGDGDGVFETVWAGPGQDYQLEVTQHEYNTGAKGEPWPYTKIQALGVPGGKYLPYVWAWSHQDRVQVTGVFGWPAVPVLVRQASLQLAADFFKLKDAPFGVAGFSEYGAVRVRDNPQIAAMLSRYIKSKTKVGV